MKKRVIVCISVTVILLFIVVILFYVKSLYKNPPELYAKIEGSDFIKCIKGGYSWTSGLIFKESVVADAAHVTQMEYKDENIVYVKPGQKVVFECRGYEDNNNGLTFSKESITCYNERNIEEEITLLEDKNVNHNMEINAKAPNEEGIYIFRITINYGKRGKAEYGLKVIVSLDNIENKAFIGEVIEVKEAGQYIIKPIQGQEILNSADKISINVNLVRGFKLGDKIRVTYTGEVMETYPAKVNVINANIYDESSLLISSYISLEDIPKDYTIEDATNGHCFIVTNKNIVYNKELMDLFLSNIENNNYGFVRVVQFTVEGDMIITDIQFENGIFTVFHDSTRDEFSAESDRIIKEYVFEKYEYTENDYGKYLSLFNGESLDKSEINIEIPISIKEIQ